MKNQTFYITVALLSYLFYSSSQAASVQSTEGSAEGSTNPLQTPSIEKSNVTPSPTRIVLVGNKNRSSRVPSSRTSFLRDERKLYQREQAAMMRVKAKKQSRKANMKE